jgi:hypothetical protein
MDIDHLVNFVLIWYIYSGFGIMYQDKSGNPGHYGHFINGRMHSILWFGIRKMVYGGLYLTLH